MFRAGGTYVYTSYTLIINVRTAQHGREHWRKKFKRR